MDFYEPLEIAEMDLIADWNAIRLAVRERDELEEIQKVIARVCCQKMDMYDAGKKVEKLNPGQNSVFPRFMLKFVSLYQKRPGNRQSFANVMFHLKIIDLGAEHPENPADFSVVDDMTPTLEMAGNIVIKDILENAVNLYPNDRKPRKISARDLLDALIMSDDPESFKYKEKTFLKLKQKLMGLTGEVTDFEKKLFSNESSGSTAFPSLYGKTGEF